MSFCQLNICVDATVLIVVLLDMCSQGHTKVLCLCMFCWRGFPKCHSRRACFVFQRRWGHKQHRNPPHGALSPVRYPVRDPAKALGDVSKGACDEAGRHPEEEKVWPVRKLRLRTLRISEPRSLGSSLQTREFHP